MTEHRLSKSRFVAGLQCHKLLWWRVHEPDAEELQPDKVLQDLFSQGRHVGRVATEQFPGGHLIDLPYYDYEGKTAATQEALAEGVNILFEGTLTSGPVSVSVDVLKRDPDGFELIEVKSSTSQKQEHIWGA